MKISVASFLVLTAVCASAVSASPVSTNNSLETVNIEQSLNLAPSLDKRTFVCPCQANDNLISVLMGSFKADLNARIFSPISVTFSERAAASMGIYSFLGGAFDIGMSTLQSIEASAIASLRASFSASLEARINAEIYAEIEAKLRRKCGNRKLTDDMLIAILVEIHAEARTLIQARLPTISAGLQTKAKSCVGSTIFGIRRKGDAHGSAKGNVHGSAKGDAHGSVKGDAHGSAKGDAHGSVKGDAHGSVKGDAHGSVKGNVHGSAKGNVHGSVKGDAHGSVKGNVHGSAKGNVHGSVKGNVHGSVKGDAHGSVKGDAHGSAKGNVHGSAKGESDYGYEYNFNTELEGSFNAKATIDASINTGLKGCNNWNHESFAKKVIASL
ncbi:hypothetical protein CU098_010764 [Rhizopus stolonifer]|uniref:Uncharacterized protein n=1 Tax=Rhizopus stolonifer TaxID=4846 RepID=A0A367KNJ7_RHIST|nr:hypothetical protein CU098_010764 [Rhizopus stolonifer]